MSGNGGKKYAAVDFKAEFLADGGTGWVAQSESTALMRRLPNRQITSGDAVFG